MPSSILNSDDGVISGTSGLKSSGGDDGTLKIQANGVDAISINASQVVTFANSPSGVASLSTASGSAPSYSARAWVNFDGTTNVGGNCTIRASGNVSTVADNGTGDYTVNFTTAMPDANYSAAGLCRISGNSRNIISLDGVNTALATGSVRVKTLDASLLDADFVCVSIFR